MAAGVGADLPVPIRRRAVCAEEKLGEIVAVAGARRETLAWTIGDGTVIVSTRAAIARQCVTRGYPVFPHLLNGRPMTELVDVIHESVAPDTWADPGFALIRVINNDLVVTQTQENQRLV